MFPIEALRGVHLELSSHCNASCPMCARTVDGGVLNPQLYLSELRLADIERLFAGEIARPLREVLLCGTYGEPTMARDYREIVAFFRENSPNARIVTETNGSVRSPGWWRELGALLAPTKHVVSFNIDGLADTNPLYRRGTSFEKILANAAAFLAGGGYARWTFIAFRHNEHQVEEARARAAEVGFQSFLVKKTGRFFSSSPRNYKKRERFAVLNERGETEYYLEPPTRPEYLNDAVENAPAIAERHGTFENYLDQTPIACDCLHRGKIFVSANRKVLPCSFLQHQLFDRPGQYGRTQGQSAQLIDLDEVDGGVHTLAEILASDSFRRVVESWDRPSIAAGRLKACALYCGQEFDRVKTQFSGLYGAS